MRPESTATSAGRAATPVPSTSVPPLMISSCTEQWCHASGRLASPACWRALLQTLALPRIRFIFVPQVGHVPCAARRPLANSTSWPSNVHASLGTSRSTPRSSPWQLLRSVSAIGRESNVAAGFRYGGWSPVPGTIRGIVAFVADNGAGQLNDWLQHGRTSEKCAEGPGALWPKSVPIFRTRNGPCRRVPGWDVKDQLSHLIGIELAISWGQPVPVGRAPRLDRC